MKFISGEQHCDQAKNFHRIRWDHMTCVEARMLERSLLISVAKRTRWEMSSSDSRIASDFRAPLKAGNGFDGLITGFLKKNCAFGGRESEYFLERGGDHPHLVEREGLQNITIEKGGTQIRRCVNHIHVL